jgi:RNA polymerase sigma-70 factor, ECF subfamily
LSKEEGGKNSSSDGDQELVSASRNGDRRAFEALVRKHQSRMMNIAFRMTGDYDEACETVQEAFLAAYRGIKKFRSEAMFSTWLYSICVNHAKNCVGRRQRRATHEVHAVEDECGRFDDALQHEPADPHSSVVEQLERKALQDKVQKCIDELSQEQKEILVLRDVEGFSYEEIGAMLALPEGTIKSRLFRARDNFRIGFKEFLGDY